MTTNRFDEAASTWDENPVRMAVTKAIANGIQEAIPLTESMSMLDFGCGTGTLSVLLARRVGHIHAMDTSDGMIAEFKRKLADLPEISSQIQPCLLDGPLDQALEGTWDLVCSSMVLHHINDAVGTVRRLADLVGPGGYLALADLMPEDGSFHGAQAVPHNGFDPAALALVMREAGLDHAAWRKVTSFNKPIATGEMREYSIFLLTASRPG